MALKGKLEFEVKLKANADQFYQTLRRQSHEIPRMSSDKVQGVHIQKGDGKSKGSVKKWDYTLDGEEISATETIEAADDSKKMITFKIMDGEIMKALKNFKATAQAIPKEEGCLVKWILEYEKRSQNIPDPVDYRELATKICRDMDGHLAANFN